MPSTKKANHNFAGDVHEVAKLVPRGRVTSYGAIAHYLGRRITARMVGWAMHACPPDVPAHRVVNSKGMLSGKQHFKTPDTMQKLLEKEGHQIVDDKILRFGEVFWNPSEELA